MNSLQYYQLPTSPFSAFALPCPHCRSFTAGSAMTRTPWPSCVAWWGPLLLSTLKWQMSSE